MIRNFLSPFLPFRIDRLWLPVVGEGVRHATSIAIEGHVRLPYDLRSKLVSHQPAVVARFSETGKIASFAIVKRLAADSCWETPIGCKFGILLNDVLPGEYRFSFELIDELFQSSRGASGTSQVIAYYGGPSRGPEASRVSDIREAAIVSVDTGAPNQHLEMNL